MSLEKIFCGESSAFQFAAWALFVVLYGVSSSVYFRFVVRFNIVCGAVLHSLWCGSTWSNGAFEYVEWLCEKVCAEEEGSSPLRASSTNVVGAGRLEQLYLNTQTQSVCVGDEVDLRYCFIIITYEFG